MIRQPTLKAYRLILKADKNCKKAKQIKKDPKNTAKKGSIGGLSIIRPEPMTKKYRMPATVSQIPLAKNVRARGLNDLFSIFFSPMNCLRPKILYKGVFPRVFNLGEL
jgi:hypothetical protein